MQHALFAAQRDLARSEGIFCEPASAASVAGLRRMTAEGRLTRDETVVAVLTGNGLKDPETPAAGLPPLLVADARTDDVRRVLGWP